MKKTFVFFVVFILISTTSSLVLANKPKLKKVFTYSNLKSDRSFYSDTGNVSVKNFEIQEMVDICIKLNYIENPNLIYEGSLLLWSFPDNPNFQFYQIIYKNQSLWDVARYLLVVTKNHSLKSNDDDLPKVKTEVVFEKAEDSTQKDDDDIPWWYGSLGFILLIALPILFFGVRRLKK